MAKTEVRVKTTKVEAGARRKSTTNSDLIKSKGTKLSQRQTYKSIKRQQKIDMQKVKNTGGWIRQTGSAIAEATSPIAGSITANKAIAQYTSSKRASADAALAEWQKQISGNPDPQTGADGSTQQGSTTNTTSAGKFSLLD